MDPLEKLQAVMNHTAWMLGSELCTFVGDDDLFHHQEKKQEINYLKLKVESLLCFKKSKANYKFGTKEENFIIYISM